MTAVRIDDHGAYWASWTTAWNFIDLVAKFRTFRQLPTALLARTATELLMKFINALLEFFSATCRLPTKLSTLRKQAGIGAATNGVKRYVVCPKCFKTFDIDGFDLNQPGDIVGQNCRDHKEFPLRNVTTYGQRLFKCSSGNRAVPIKEYAYISVKRTLGIFFNLPDFVEKINIWRHRSLQANVMYDIYDGQMWKQLKDVDAAGYDI